MDLKGFQLLSKGYRPHYECITAKFPLVYVSIHQPESRPDANVIIPQINIPTGFWMSIKSRLEGTQPSPGSVAFHLKRADYFSNLSQSNSFPPQLQKQLIFHEIKIHSSVICLCICDHLRVSVSELLFNVGCKTFSYKKKKLMATYAGSVCISLKSRQLFDIDFSGQ